MLPYFNDIELWNAAAQGDREAFGQLFRRHYALLHQYGSKITTDTPQLEDCIQELFAELWQKRSGTPVKSVKAYLLQALKFKLYKSFREKDRSKMNERMPDEPFELSHENFMIRKHDSQEKIQKVIEALNQLPSRQKEIIYLKLYKGLSYEEVSDIMQINYQVVRNLMCEALKTFRKVLMPADDAKRES